MAEVGGVILMILIVFGGSWLMACVVDLVKALRLRHIRRSSHG